MALDFKPLHTIYVTDILLIAKKAGEAVMELFSMKKGSGSSQGPRERAEAYPELAYRASEEIIRSSLTRLYPDIPYVSPGSYGYPYEKRKAWDYFWLANPLNGKKEFSMGRGDFSIDIGLVHKKSPSLGVVCLPARRVFYYAKKGYGCFREEFARMDRLKRRHVKPALPRRKGITIIADRSGKSGETSQKLADFRKKQGAKVILSGGSGGICHIAEGKADLYMRLAPSMEWETAALHSIIRESGGKLLVYGTKKEMGYNKKGFVNDWLFIV